MNRPRRLVVVFGTATDIGKTWVSCRLLEAARTSGLRVAARKPAQSYPPSDVLGRDLAPLTTRIRPRTVGATDAELLAGASGEAAVEVCPEHRWYPLAQAPPMAATALGRPPIRLADLVAEMRWPAGVDLGVVETAGGPLSPIAQDGDGVDLARALQPDVAVLVADAGLGTINAVRLCVAAIAPVPVVVLLNRFDPTDPLHAANLRWLTDVDHLHVVTSPADLLGAAATGCRL